MSEWSAYLHPRVLGENRHRRSSSTRSGSPRIPKIPRIRGGTPILAILGILGKPARGPQTSQRNARRKPRVREPLERRGYEGVRSDNGCGNRSQPSGRPIERELTPAEREGRQSPSAVGDSQTPKELTRAAAGEQKGTA